MTDDTTTADAIAVVDAYGRALAARDQTAILSLYVEDAEIVPENLPSLRGSQAIDTFYTDTFAEIGMEVTLQVRSAEVHDGFAVVRSEQPVMVTTVADGTRIPSYFRELFVLRKTSAGWRICNYMFSQSPGQAETPGADDGREKA
ncbi:YybH family protein [Nocardia carnea]|uniref:YybH family protein n=1 Tax=Nocardia carnea TaxID=37328 RepID=UPI002457623D|nr:SgcJ/EcaC family oxidoreductase [Nocardia carnea]